MTVHELYEMLGDWGRFQRQVFFLLALPVILQGFQAMMVIVTFAVPKHRCKVPGLKNDTFQIQTVHHLELVEGSIPFKVENGQKVFDQCRIYRNHENGTNGNHSDVDLIGCESWVYDQSEFKSTVMTQFDLVCGRKDFRAHFNMVYMAGLLFGSPVVGFFCDRFGRKPSFFACVLLMMVTGIISAFPPSTAVFLVYRFLSGFANIGTYLALYVLALELVGPSKRTFASSMIAVVWLCGPFLVAALSYGVTHWRDIQLISSVPLALGLATWWLIPESPRWLLSKGRIVQAVGVIRRIARVNKIALPPVVGSLDQEDENPKSTEGPLRLLKYPNLVVRTLIIFFNWSVVSMTYYGLSLNVSNLVGSVRVNFLLSNTVELVGYVSAWVLLDRMGRKRLHCGFMGVSGIALLATVPTVIWGGTGLQWLTTALAMVGKLGVSGSFSVIYLMSAELYPTVIRNFGMGCSSTVARVGSAVSPYIADLGLHIGGSFGRALPLVVFGGLAVTAGLLSLLLPETLRRKLPDTLEEAANFGKTEKMAKEAEDVSEMQDVLLEGDKEQKEKEDQREQLTV